MKGTIARLRCAFVPGNVTDEMAESEEHTGNDVTSILHAIRQGAARGGDELMPAVYAELRRIARAKMAREQPGHTLQATALVHDLAAPRRADV